MTAMTAATLDTLSNGRFRLGLGVSGPQVSEGWHGVSFARPRLAHARVRGDRARRARARGAARVRGQGVRLPVEGTGLGKPLKLLIQPPRADIPIYLGAIGPKAVEQTARDRRRLDPVLLQPRPGRGDAAPVRASGPRRRRVPRRARLRGRRRGQGARHGAAVAGDLPRRHGREGQELLRRDGRANGPRRLGARGPGAVHGRRPGGRRRGDQRRDHRRLLDLLPRRATWTTASPTFERAGVDTLLAMPFGDRPRIVEALAAAARGRATT